MFPRNKRRNKCLTPGPSPNEKTHLKRGEERLWKKNGDWEDEGMTAAGSIRFLETRGETNSPSENLTPDPSALAGTGPNAIPRSARDKQAHLERGELPGPRQVSPTGTRIRSAE